MAASLKAKLPPALASLCTTHEAHCSMRNPTTSHEAHLCGIEHNTRLNADYIFQVLQDMAAKAKAGSKKKPVVLMESLQLPQGQKITTGSVIPYEEQLPQIGLNNAMTLVQDPVFRAQLTGEMVAVLQALKLGLEIRFCDRLNTVSVDMLLKNRSVKELEAMADAALTVAVAEAVKRGLPIHGCQSFILPSFPELFQERQRVMAHYARQATEERDALVVVNKHHMEGIASLWDPPVGPVDELLVSPPFAVETQLQSRGLLLALCKVTNAFSMDAITDFPRALTEAEVQTMRDHVTMYLNMFQMKTTEATIPDPADPRNKINALVGISSLMRLLLQLQMEPKPSEQQP